MYIVTGSRRWAGGPAGVTGTGPVSGGSTGSGESGGLIGLSCSGRWPRARRTGTRTGRRHVPCNGASRSDDLEPARPEVRLEGRRAVAVAVDLGRAGRRDLDSHPRPGEPDPGTRGRRP